MENCKDCKKECLNTNECTCPNTGCKNHGRCCDCVAFHRGKGNTPNCYKYPPKEE